MATTSDLIDRIQKYEGMDKFLILNKNGNKLNSENKEDDKTHKGSQAFSTNYTEIPKLVEKATSIVRNIDPLVSIEDKYIFID